MQVTVGLNDVYAIHFKLPFTNLTVHYYVLITHSTIFSSYCELMVERLGLRAIDTRIWPLQDFLSDLGGEELVLPALSEYQKPIQVCEHRPS